MFRPAGKSLYFCFSCVLALACVYCHDICGLIRAGAFGTLAWMTEMLIAEKIVDVEANHTR